jgi:hypothetical protein
MVSCRVTHLETRHVSIERCRCGTRTEICISHQSTVRSVSFWRSLLDRTRQRFVSFREADVCCPCQYRSDNRPNILRTYSTCDRFDKIEHIGSNCGLKGVLGHSLRCEYTVIGRKVNMVSCMTMLFVVELTGTRRRHVSWSTIRALCRAMTRPIIRRISKNAFSNC